ncbi:MAG: restriction endonuclease [Deltaproteobacteria bacterium]|nr:restriction endonuclease [Deltaproteobacteria bacterium]
MQEAKAILKARGLPEAQQNDNAAFTFLAFAAMAAEDPWAAAKAPRLRPHDVIAFLKSAYGKTYAENSCETIRRQAIHQFEQGGVLVRNPDEPALATNSPRTRYALTLEALAVARAYGTEQFDAMVGHFISQAGGGLAAKYGAPRRAVSVTLTLASGETLTLSPGDHNHLEACVVREFLPYFAPQAQVLYLGDTSDKALFVKREELERLGLPFSEHDKFPDIVAYDALKGWLFLIEAVICHGPISAKRLAELEKMLQGRSAGRVYVTAFPSFKVFQRYAAELAWDTEVWIAEFPEHMLHFNGDLFIGPRNRGHDQDP